MDVDTYVPAITKLANQGNSVLRVGSHNSKKLSASHPKIIDYSTNGLRTDFLDIYLPDKCFFFASSGSGLDGVPSIFRKPTLYVNIIPLEYMNAESDKNLIIFKKIWMIGKNGL